MADLPHRVVPDTQSTLNFEALDRTKQYGLNIVNVKEYGARGDGIADDRPRIQQAVDAVHASGGGVVYLPPGNYYLGSKETLPVPNDGSYVPLPDEKDFAIRLPSGSSGLTIKGAGRGVTTITLSSGCERAFDIYGLTLQETFQNLTVEDLTVDANDTQPTTSGHRVIGTWVEGGWSDRLNLYNIRVSRVNGINMWTDTSGATMQQSVSLVCRHGYTSLPVNTFRHIVVEDCDFEGSNSGVVIAASGITGGYPCEVDMDDIRIQRCTHDTGVTPAAFWLSSNFHIGAHARAASITIEDCIGKRSADTGVEINNVDHALIRGVRIEDCYTAAFFTHNYTPTTYPDNQMITYEGCSAVWENLDPSQVIAAPAWKIALNNTAVQLNTYGGTIQPPSVTLRDCSVHVETDMDGGMSSGKGILCDRGALRRLVVDGFTISTPNCALDPGVANYPSWIYIRPRDAERVILRDVIVRAAGTISSDVRTRAVWLSGVQNVDIDGLDIDLDLTGSSSGYASMLSLGMDSGSTMRGNIRGVRIINNTDDANAANIQIGSTANLTISEPFVIRDCDVGTTGTSIYYPSAAQRASTIVKQLRSGHSGSVASAATVTIPDGLEHVTITGNTGITSITASWAGHRVTLEFAADPTVTDGSNLNLAGNFNATANDTLTLSCDGTNWNEVARSVN